MQMSIAVNGTGAGVRAVKQRGGMAGRKLHNISQGSAKVQDHLQGM